jgi:hypothetical protein
MRWQVRKSKLALVFVGSFSLLLSFGEAKESKMLVKQKNHPF